MPGSSRNRASLFSSIPDMPARAKAALSLPETKVETNILKDYTKQPQSADSKSRLDGEKLNEDVLFESFKALKDKTVRKRVGGKKKPTTKKKTKQQKQKKKKEPKKKPAGKVVKKTKQTLSKKKAISKHFDVLP